MTDPMKTLTNGRHGPVIEGALEGARRATGNAPSVAPPAPDPEVPAIARRRQFSGADKRRIVSAADRCTEPGQIGALLRREGIYSSMLAAWRKQLGAVERAALSAKRRGPKPDAAARQIAHLNRDIVRLRRKLERAELIIDAQKKLCVALGLPTADPMSEDE